MLKIIKKIYPLLLCALLFVFTGCASDDIADRVVKENIDDLYLVILGEDIAESIDVNNLTVSVNEFDKTYTSRKHKLIVVTDSYAQNITSEQVSNLKNLITKDKYWVLYHCNDTSKVNSFAHNFGKAISSTEQNYLIGYKLLYNKTQCALQGIPSYSTSNIFGIKELNNTIKQTFRDMIENRYEDIV